MYERAKVVKYEERQEGTYIIAFLPDRHKMDEIEKKHINTCGIWLNDGRRMSSEQRGMIYATLRDIAEYNGDYLESIKMLMKYRHLDKKGKWIQTLSDCSMDDARDFIDTILEFAIEYGVPLMERLYKRSEFVGNILCYCIKFRKCCCCGEDGEIHHVDTIGMGSDRKKYDDSDSRKMCLCRKHHTKAHTMGIDDFEEIYHVYGVIYN